MTMHRTQILLEERQYRYLLARSRQSGKSLSALFREMVDTQMHAQPKALDPVLDLIGIADGPDDATAREHDRILYGKD